MKNEAEWIKELSALAASSEELRESLAGEIGFEVSGNRIGLDLSSGRLTDGSIARAWVSGTQEAFSHIVSGSITLQRAHLMGRVKLSGDPEELFRFARLLDMLGAMRERQAMERSADSGRDR